MEDELEFVRPAKVYFMDTNLSSPVLLTEIADTKRLLDRTIAFAESSEMMWKATAKQRSEFFYMKKLCNHNGWTRSFLRTSVQMNPDVYPAVEEAMLLCSENHDSLYSEAKAIACDIEEAVAAGLEKRGLPREGIAGTADKLGSSSAYKYMCAYEQFTDMFSRAESRVKTNEHAWTYASIGEVELWIHPNYSLIRFQGVFYHSSLSQVLMLKDKIATRFMLLEHVAPLRLNIGLTRHLLALFEWQDLTLKEYGNRAYGVLKAVEPMFKTRLSHITDNVFGSDTAYTRMIIKMQEKEDKILESVKSSYSSMAHLITVVEQVTTIDEIVEMFGCLKSCGHPLIDAEKGGLSAAEEARSKDQTSLADAQRLRNTFCHIVLMSYLEKHGKWPPLIFTKQGTRLEVLSVRQERSFTRQNYDLEDWTSVHWKKMFEMDYFPDFLELMDDKSISYYRSEKHLSWDFGQRPRSERRLLLEVLKRNNISIESLVKRVSNRDIPWDWFIVSLYPKEREFKEDPRMFAMLVLEMRCFFTCIEANIADHLFKYMPQQTMTKSKTQIQERFLKFTDPNRRASVWTLFLEIDLSRWNLKWREMVIHLLGHDLNNMFGVKGTFTVTHWFFSLCQIIVRVNGLRPDGIETVNPPETGLAWRDHKGGFEGLNQKLWTAATYAMVEMALAPLIDSGKISSYELIGQGDNQVIRAEIPMQDKLREEVLPPIRDEMNELLRKTCASVGQEVKPEENIESTTVLTYSKDVYVSGVEYPTTLKKHSRLFPVTATDFPSLPMKASAIMAGAVAGAENSRHPLCSAVVGWYHTARYLLAASRGRSIHGSQYPRMTNNEIIAALILPPSIGGLIGTPIASFLYKAGSDPLGKEVSSLRLLADGVSISSEIASRALRALEERYYIDPDPNLESLIDNPYGLPINKNASPISRVSHLTLTAFRSKVENRDIKPLLDDRISSAESVLKTDILSVKPLNPLLAHDLFEASGFGTIKLMRKMFLTTRTVQTVAQIVNPNITHQFLRSDLNEIKWFKKWLSSHPARGYSGRSSFDLVTLFRSYWGVDLHGVTNYQPLDFIHSAGTTRDPSSIKWSSHSTSDLLTTRGPLTGYLGTATREKRSEHGYKIVDAGAPSRAMMKLQLIRSQAYGNPHFNLLLDKIGLTRTNVPLSEITDLLQKVIGGSIAHRYATAIRNMSASYVGPLNFVTHIRIDTDSLGKISGSALNYPVMTQELMIFTLAGAKLLNVHRGVKMGELIIDSQSMVPLPDDSLSASRPKFKETYLPQSKLLYTTKLQIARTYDSVVQQIPRGVVAHPDTYDEKETIEHGVLGFFMDLLRDNNKAKTLADTRGVASLPSRLQMDIAEAHALGPLTLTKCMAYAIITSFLRDAFRTLHLHPERWDEGLFLMHNIVTCVRSCARYWRHPLFFGHPDSDKFRSSPMRYAGWMTSDRVIAAEVRYHITRVIGSSGHKFWQLPVPVFSGSQSMELTEALTIAGAKILYPLYIEGSSHARTYGNDFASLSRIPVLQSLTPDEQLSLLRARMVKLSHIYDKHGDHLIAERVKDLGHMKGVVAFNDDYRTVLRYSRTLTVGQGTVRPRKPRPEVSGALNRSHCLRCRPLEESRFKIMWNKNAVRRKGGVTTSGYTWASILGDMRVLSTVLIAGSGNGGLADLILTAFNTEVIGADLESDLPSESATLLNYVPCGISPDNRSKYTESDLCLTTTGDWFSEDVRGQFLDSLYKMTTVIVDVTTNYTSRYLSLVEHVAKHKFVDRLYVRLLINSGDMGNVINWSNTESLHLRYWYSTVGINSDEILAEFSTKRVEAHVCSSLPALIYLPPLNAERLIPERKRESMLAATCSSMGWEGETLHEFKDKLKWLSASLLDKPRARQLLYKDRMALIYAYSTLYACCSEHPTKLIQDWIAEEIIETDVTSISMRSDLLTHLLRHVPRIRAIFTEVD
ncbi:MAG: RNA-dependent RNA polymerase [Penicillium adametzioides negative-stranded RNA virus 1]|uniref:RNA-dependent RNA polymerase n=1 Tax=Penicillium adametzioides negative-stranded RNA virus 1 TaxID=2587550 RepID=UPI0024821025|nr:MAG: RNA-dependent RNA polymerase [Penicillium adametzioides negative-stranded RNA virus 1]QDB75019.1 MAG: RNA-dependent RNA polymerase [Penicillium adametzioides negative-stranded RNA virus 1]